MVLKSLQKRKMFRERVTAQSVAKMLLIEKKWLNLCQVQHTSTTGEESQATLKSRETTEVRSHFHKCACRSWEKGFQRNSGWFYGTGPARSEFLHLWSELCASSSSPPPSGIRPLSSEKRTEDNRCFKHGSSLLLFSLHSVMWLNTWNTHRMQ